METVNAWKARKKAERAAIVAAKGREPIPVAVPRGIGAASPGARDVGYGHFGKTYHGD